MGMGVELACFSPLSGLGSPGDREKPVPHKLKVMLLTIFMKSLDSAFGAVNHDSGHVKLSGMHTLK